MVCLRDIAAVLDWVVKRERSAFPGVHWRPALLGYSRGAVVAMLCAQRYAAVLSGLILRGFPYRMEALSEARQDPGVPQ